MSTRIAALSTSASVRAARAATNDTTCQFQPLIEELRASLNSALRGKSRVVELVLAALLARGHILIEDFPGLGKTTLAKALAHGVGGEFARIQCTPDLLPSDITGFNIFNQKTHEFQFVAGPVFADVLLADEINRATPRSQSALFEAMAERQVTIDNACRPLSETFFVIATQNSVESRGTYPLPEAQLDRFAVKLNIGYPDRDSELEMLADDRLLPRGADQHSSAVINSDQLARLQCHVATVHVCDSVRDYLVRLGGATRTHPHIRVGISPRGLLIWQRLARAVAHLAGRDYVIPDDVQALGRPVLEIRLIGDFDSPIPVIEEILASVPVPTVKKLG
jgi:MoxR-like ATPase